MTLEEFADREVQRALEAQEAQKNAPPTVKRYDALPPAVFVS